MTDIMFTAPWRGIAEDVCDELAAPQDQQVLPWEHGEPDYFYRVEHRVGRGWCVCRYVRGEQIEEPPF